MGEVLSEELYITVAPCPKVVRQRMATTCECKVCRGSARYSYYGAIVCNACKVFFKRNAFIGQTVLKCRLHGQCDIQHLNGHMCSLCRLNKCFRIGMSAQMIRCGHSTKNEKHRKIESMAGSASSTGRSLVRSLHEWQSQQTPTSNLLKSDQSILNIDQWTQLSNLVHSFDKYGRQSFTKQYVQNQNALPPKLRYKYSSVKDFIVASNINAQVACEKNRDALILSSQDRATLRRTTVKRMPSIGSMLMMRQYHLLDDLSYYKSVELIFVPTAVAVLKRASDQLDPDSTFIKVIIAALAFSTISYTIYDESTSCKSIDVRSILSMQDTYTELAWRYLCYKYGDEQAVIRISNLLRCLFLVNETVVEAHKTAQYSEIVDSILKQTEQRLGL